MKEGADDDARSQTLYPVGDQGGDDDREVVEEGRDGGEEEVLARVQDAHEHAAGGE